MLQSPSRMGFAFVLAVLMVAPHTGFGKLRLITPDEVGAVGAACHQTWTFQGLRTTGQATTKWTVGHWAEWACRGLEHGALGNTFFVIPLLLLPMSQLSLEGLCCAPSMPDHHNSHAVFPGDHQPLTYSHVYKNLKNCL